MQTVFDQSDFYRTLIEVLSPDRLQDLPAGLLEVRLIQLEVARAEWMILEIPRGNGLRKRVTAPSDMTTSRIRPRDG